MEISTEEGHFFDQIKKRVRAGKELNRQKLPRGGDA